MTFIQIIDTFTFYGFDVAALAFITTVAVQILKKTILKSVNKKIFTFLPFIVGTVLYAAYYAAINVSLRVLVSDYVAVLEHGISVGAVATLVYVMYEQFVREKNTLSATEGVIKTLIEAYVPPENLERVAKEIAAAIEKDVTGGGARKAAEILTENCGDIDENSVNLLAKLIIETLAHLTAAGKP